MGWRVSWTGAPETGAVQEVIAWQSRTIAMMYKLVADALRDIGDNEHVPTDYLLFFCLGMLPFHPELCIRASI